MGFYLDGVWLWRISGAITGDNGFGFMELVFFKRIGEARTKLMGIEENDNGQGNGSVVKWCYNRWESNAYKNAYKWGAVLPNLSTLLSTLSIQPFGNWCSSLKTFLSTKVRISLCTFWVVVQIQFVPTERNCFNQFSGQIIINSDDYCSVLSN